MTYTRLPNRKKAKRQGDSYSIATFDLPYETDKKSKKNKLLSQGYRLYIRDGKTILEKDGRKIEV